MKITRTIEGHSFEIELNAIELMQAHFEFQHICDIEDVKNTLERFDGHERLLKPVSVLMDDEKLIEELARAHRNALDNDPDWSEVCYSAIEDVLLKKGLMQK